MSQQSCRYSKHCKKIPDQATAIFWRRRRNKALIINILIISVLSIVAALVITWQSGGTGFSVSDSTGRSAIAPPSPSVKHSAPALPSLSEEEQDGYKLETGPLAVIEVAGLVLHDDKRNKDVRVRIFYPVIAGKYPVIILSHMVPGNRHLLRISDTPLGNLWLHYASVHP